MEKLITLLLHKSQIFHINADDLSLQFISHPEAPSIRAITDTLDYFGISNIALQAPKEALDQLPNDFIAVIENEGQSEVILVNQKKKRIKITSENEKNFVVPLTEFEKLWTGVIVVVEKTASDSLTFQQRLNLNTSLPGLLLLSVIAIALLIPSQPFTLLYTFLTGLGLTLSYFIAKEGLGIKDPLAAKVCGSISKNKEGCSTVINADQGRFLKNVKLADACIVFFGALLLGIMTVGIDHSMLYALSIAALPIVGVSIYLQAFVIKKWCTLCLGISLVLISQFALLQLTFVSWEFSLIYLLKGIFALIVAIFIWSVLKEFWKDSIELKSTLAKYYRFKRNNETFFHLLDKSDKRQTTVERNHQITFGESKALVKVHAVTNPLCGFCQESFEQYDRLLNLHPEDIQVNFTFAVPDDPENQASQITLRIIELYQEDPNEAYKALKDWFQHRNMENWMSKYGSVTKESLLPEQVVAAHQQWCAENQIFHTPVTIINEHLFPTENYEIIDLQFFIEDIKEHVTDQMKVSLELVS